MSDTIAVTVLSAAEAEAALPELVAVLRDAVEDGASVGFLPPFSDDDGVSYWRDVVRAIADGSRVLFVARRGDEPVLGTVQLDLAQRANGRHRAEVSKLLVLRAARRQGLGRSLMVALEAEAARLGRTTLILDTRQGDPSERLYQGLGYSPVGAIPQYARGTDGALHPTAFYYKLLPAADDTAH